MKEQVALAVALLALTMTTEIGAAAYVNAQQLHEECSDQRAGNYACLIYTTAIADVMSTTVVNNFRACIPHDVTSEQLRDVVAKWLADHPEMRHYAAAGVVAEALQTAFPC